MPHITISQSTAYIFQISIVVSDDCMISARANDFINPTIVTKKIHFAQRNSGAKYSGNITDGMGLSSALS
jgi:hypothetical protein